MKRLLAAAVVMGGLLSSGVASAAPIQGTFDLSGLGNVQVYASAVDFGLSQGPGVDPVFDSGPGDVLFTGGTGTFANVGGTYPLPLTTGLVKDLNFAVAPVNQDFLLQNFLTSDAHGELAFDLTFIKPGSGTDAGCNDNPGSVCTPDTGVPGFLSPFTLTNTDLPLPISSSAALTMNGLVRENGIVVATFTAIFSTQFDRLTSDDVLQKIEDETFIPSSYSASFTVTPVDTPPVPEPASLALMGLAFAGMGIAIRRRK